MATNENLPPNVIKQLVRELKNLDETPPLGIKVGVNDDDFSTILKAQYENGVFRMKLLLSRDFPHSPPKGYFLTKIFHPNIATNGEICVNTLKRDWNPSLGLRHVLYTEIHALKPKQKFKAGVISESTAAAVARPSSVCSVDPKHVESGVVVPTPLAPSLNTMKEKSGQDHPTTAATVTPTGEIGVGSGSGVAPPPMAVHKKECGSAKPQADKKKVDARKKSLKRL
ncbi:putative ubiquitin-conjugating enzyme E2, ubiquitin-conjugating enzyme/RWD [Helianthus annuus]|nr:putative ubiquitin-conjugating enzyme E2, ubiquitin-conjugating enzyme/RWD [Helianthus annuus]